jgi:hypothetical protein
MTTLEELIRGLEFQPFDYPTLERLPHPPEAQASDETLAELAEYQRSYDRAVSAGVAVIHRPPRPLALYERCSLERQQKVLQLIEETGWVARRDAILQRNEARESQRETAKRLIRCGAVLKLRHGGHHILGSDCWNITSDDDGGDHILEETSEIAYLWECE